MGDNWASDMERMIGRVLQVKAVLDTGALVYTPDKSDWWYFKAEALERVEDSVVRL
jgi:hypothetical protein